jgi:hypothetical protein
VSPSLDPGEALALAGAGYEDFLLLPAGGDDTLTAV